MMIMQLKREIKLWALYGDYSAPSDEIQCVKPKWFINNSYLNYRLVIFLNLQLLCYNFSIIFANDLIIVVLSI